MPTLAEAASYGVPTNLNQTTSVNGVGLVWDHKGNLDQHGTTDYQWTFGNRLWRVVRPASTTEYAYDSTDRRTMVIEDGVMTRTLWSGADEVGEYDAAGTLKRRFIPDGSGAMDARLAMVSSTGDVSWFHTNHQGSVIAMSNASGAATGFANYSEYGKFGTNGAGSPLNSPPGGSPFGYTGRQWDAKAGLYNYRARYYDPVLGVFLSMDPIGTKDDPNLYGYVGQDPVNGNDPTGLSCERNSDQKGYTCVIDNPGNLQGQELDDANEAYTRSVNRLMHKPNKEINVTIGDGRGGTRSGNTSQGEVAQVLIDAEVTYQDGDGSRNAEYSFSTGSLTVFEVGVNQGQDGLGITFIHEGMHGTDMDRTFRQWFRDDKRWYEFSRNSFSVFNNAHQVDESPPGAGYRGAATSAYRNWNRE